MARTGKTGDYNEFKQRTEGQVSDETKRIVSAIVDRICVALDMSRSSVSRLLTMHTKHPDKKLDSKIGNLINKGYSQIPWKDTIEQVASLIPSAEDPDRAITPGELWEIFAGLRDYKAQFIDGEDFDISTEDFDRGVNRLGDILKRKEVPKAVNPHYVEVEPECFEELIRNEIRDREITLEDFAKVAGLAPNVLYKMLKGEEKSMSRANFARLALHLINPATGDAFGTADALIGYCGGEVSQESQKQTVP